MRTIVVTSTRPYTGKSGIALALIGILADRGLDVGYFKPYGTMPVIVDGVPSDEDAVYINRALARPSAQADVCPVVRSQTFVEQILAEPPGFADAHNREMSLPCQAVHLCLAHAQVFSHVTDSQDVMIISSWGSFVRHEMSPGVR